MYIVACFDRFCAGAYIELRLAKRQPFRFAKTALPSLALRCQRMPANSFMNARVAEQYSNPKRGILAFPAPMATCRVCRHKQHDLAIGCCSGTPTKAPVA